MEATRESAQVAAAWISKGVDRENWITISKVAVPLAEVTGACILADVTDLIYGSL